MSEKFLLLFEDGDITAKNVKDQLKDDFKVDRAKNQDELRDYLEPDHYSVIVTDVQIDGSGGIPATEIIHDIRRKRRITRTPIIVYSGVKNMDIIEKEENKMFRYYVTKGERGWLSKLEDYCLLSAKEDRHLVSWRTFQGYFEEEKIIDLSISKEDITSAAIIMGITLGDKTTNRTIIDWLKNPELDDGAWEELEKILWKKYTDHYSENHKTQ
jgi:CheY-like chemotaxis protein